MILKVYEENEQETIVRLQLYEYNDTVKLRIVDENGYLARNGVILTISQAGIRRHSDLDNRYGFPLDEECRIKLDE